MKVYRGFDKKVEEQINEVLRLAGVKNIQEDAEFDKKREIAKNVADYYKEEYPVWKYFNDENPAYVMNNNEYLTSDDIENNLTDNSYKTYGDETELKKLIKQVLLTLSPREERFVRLYFGIDIPERYTLQEIGDMENISRERVRQVIQKAIRKMRHPTRSRKLRGMLDDVIYSRSNSAQTNNTKVDNSKQYSNEELDKLVDIASFHTFDTYINIFGYPNDEETKKLFLTNPLYIARNPLDIWDEEMDDKFNKLIKYLKDNYGVTNFWNQYGKGNEYFNQENISNTNNSDDIDNNDNEDNEDNEDNSDDNDNENSDEHEETAEEKLDREVDIASFHTFDIYCHYCGYPNNEESKKLFLSDPLYMYYHRKHFWDCGDRLLVSLRDYLRNYFAVTNFKEEYGYGYKNKHMTNCAKWYFDDCVRHAKELKKNYFNEIDELNLKPLNYKPTDKFDFITNDSLFNI